MEEKSMEQVQDSQTLAYRLKKGDKLWIDGYFVELVKSPRFGGIYVCKMCGFGGRCRHMVAAVCAKLDKDDQYWYGVGKVERQNVKQQIVEPK